MSKLVKLRMPRKRININKNLLYSYYWEQGLSQVKIAKIFGCNKVTIFNRFKHFNIPKKSNSEARMRYKKYDFTDNSAAKAYLIGFRLGDLNVYQTSNRSELVVIRSNTTHQVQTDLITQLFSPYGKVTISTSLYGTNINCFVNRTFKFMLPKHLKVPSWIDKSQKTIAAFIAGYVDAEGNFLLNQSRARFKIDSYDKEILLWIYNRLTNKGINTKLRQIASMGQDRADGMKFNKDLWRLNVNQAHSLLTFIEFIEPYCKHKTRVKDILLCKKNIKERFKKGTVKIKE